MAPSFARTSGAYVFVREVGGSGGGCFRFMLSRFLREAHAMGSGDALRSVADAFEAIAEHWDGVARASRAASESDAPAEALAPLAAAIARVADREEEAWWAARAAVAA